MNNSINTGISKYFVHLIMSKLCERTYFSNFRSFPTMKPKPFWSRHWIFLYPFNFKRYFLIFYIFNILWNWLILSKCNFKDGFWFHCIFCKESRAIENKNNTSIRGRVSQNSSPKANEITNFEKFLKSMAQTKYIDGRQNIQTSSENIPDTFGNSSTLDLLRKFHTAHFSPHKLHQVLKLKLFK